MWGVYTWFRQCSSDCHPRLHRKQTLLCCLEFASQTQDDSNIIRLHEKRKELWFELLGADTRLPTQPLFVKGAGGRYFSFPPSISFSFFNVVQRRKDLRVWLRWRCGVGKAGVVYTAMWVSFFFLMATHRGLSCSKCWDLLRQRERKGTEERVPPLNI